MYPRGYSRMSEAMFMPRNSYLPPPSALVRPKRDLRPSLPTSRIATPAPGPSEVTTTISLPSSALGSFASTKDSPFDWSLTRVGTAVARKNGESSFASSVTALTRGQNHLEAPGSNWS